MSTSLRNSVFAFVFFAILLSSSSHAATPEELDAKLLKLNERVFAINPLDLSDQELVFYEEAKKYLADAQLNMNYGNYDIVEELLNAVEGRLNLIGTHQGSALSVSSSKTKLVLLIALVAGILFLLVWLLISKAKQPQQLPALNVIPQELSADKCPVCGGRVYKNVCIWCSFDYAKRAESQKKN